MRPGAGASVRLVEGLDPGKSVKLQLRGYVRPTRTRPEEPKWTATEPAAPEPDDPAFEAVVGDLWHILRGKTNLLFAGSRRNVEAYADALTDACERAGVPNEFLAHHGNLSRPHREEVEARLRDDLCPATAVATTTLELGIDIGDVASVAQVGPGSSVSSMRQRLGRSGRRPGVPAELRIFIIEDVAAVGCHPVDRLNLGLIQAIAVTNCMLDGWCEPPPPAGLHLSTLLHQILALTLQSGGIQPAAAFRQLCGRGPFRSVSSALFADLLRCMAKAAPALLEQSPQGLLMLGPGGERLTAGHDFYAVFETPDEYRIIHAGQQLGTLPLERIVLPGQALIFAGRRWRVLKVDPDARAILVEPTKAALPPRFDGGAGPLHDHVVATMRSILRGQDVPRYLDKTAAAMLEGARTAYVAMKLDEKPIIETAVGVILLPWVGTRRLDTLASALLAMDHKSAPRRHVIDVDGCDAERIGHTLARIAAGDHPDGYAIATATPLPAIAKYDNLLSPNLLREAALAERIDVASLPLTAARILAAQPACSG